MRINRWVKNRVKKDFLVNIFLNQKGFCQFSHINISVVSIYTLYIDNQPENAYR